MKLPIRILFLCTGNSCRSIIAEALANYLGKDKLIAHSAGSFPTGKVNENALAVLARHQVPVEAPASQSWDAFQDMPLDVVVTVCDAAASESCPVWLGDAVKAHWGVPDPAYIEGSDDAISNAFETTYAQMQARIEALLGLPLDTISEAELEAALGDIQSALSARETGA